MPTITSHRTRLLAVLALAVVPWTIVLRGGTITLLFPWGLVAPTQLHVTFVWDYLVYTNWSPPAYLASWPFGVGIYLLAVTSVVTERTRFGDPRVSGGLLVLMGLTQATVAWGFTDRPGYLAVPLGTLAAWTLAWWVYWPDLRDGLAVEDE